MANNEQIDFNPSKLPNNYHLAYSLNDVTSSKVKP